MPLRLRPHPHKGGSLGSRPARTWPLSGFLTFIPSILRDYGLDAGSASRMLFFSALIAAPATVVVAYLYGRLEQQEERSSTPCSPRLRRSASPSSIRALRANRVRISRP